MSKVYKLGLIVGRFQVYHLGHEDMIRRSLAICDRTLILIGSAQEANTQKNPFSYEFRKLILETVFKDEIASGKLIIRALNDIGVGNNSSWGRYVLKEVAKVIDVVPEILVSGKESRRVSWFDEEDIKIAELYIPKAIDVSSTMMRRAMIENDFAFWKQYANPLIWPLYEEMCQIVKKAQINTDTKSM